MSLLAKLQMAKKKLQPTKTIITTIDGRRLTTDGEVLSSSGYGFVVDTKPDRIPAEILPGLFLGSQDCVDPEILERYNIRSVLSIGIEVKPPPDIEWKFIECLDLPETQLEPVLDEATVFINKNQGILVHCNAGVSRSSSVVIGYLIKEKSLTFEEAFNLVKSKRECARPNDGFSKQLKDLSNKLKF